jgi:DNA-directed RNA polymerase sigma subunit (sigma70/sigma32)
VAQRNHLTRERVRRFEVAALAKLRHAPGAVDLIGFFLSGRAAV